MSAPEMLILVDDHDNPVGTMEKQEAHVKGLLHRAFSIFVWNGAAARAGAEPRMLIQQRADGKYHSGGLWTNTCCSHPREGQTLDEATHQRLQLEMGFDVPLEELFGFSYVAQFEEHLSEHEYDHVFLGEYPEDGLVVPDPEEASDYRWISLAELKRDLAEHPETYTAWFRIAAPVVLATIESRLAG